MSNSAPLETIPQTLQGAIRTRVEENRRLGTRQCTEAEYLTICERITARAPGNVLVFGLGRDSGIWMQANGTGKTVFLEDALPWIEIARKAQPDIDIHHVRYGTRRWQWRRWLGRLDDLFMSELPAILLQTAWDVIVVDAPRGNRFWHTGRMRSIYTAAVLARHERAADVFVHDCHRKVERFYTDHFFGDENLVGRVDNLRHYRVDRRARGQS